MMLKNNTIHNIFTNVPLGDVFVSNPIKLSPYNTMEILSLTGGLNVHSQCILEVKLISPFNHSYTTRNLKAIIDTGTYYNFARKQVLDLENIINEGKSVSFAPLGGSIETGQIYSCDLNIPSLSPRSIVPSFPFLINDGMFEGVDIILGTNFLRNFIFKYNFPKEGEFYLEFIPPQARD